jgi:uncharacterized protein (TIGR03067 family)
MAHLTAVALRLVCLMGVVGVSGCLTLGGPGSGDPEVRDLQQMQGEWRLAETTGFGQASPSGEGADLRLTLQGRDLALLAPGRAGKGDQVLYRGAVRLHPSSSPKAIDLVFAENGKVKHRPGIYALEEGRLRLCLAVPVEGPEEQPQRPTDFSCQPGQPYLVQTFVRGKGR